MASLKDLTTNLFNKGKQVVNPIIEALNNSNVIGFNNPYRNTSQMNKVQNTLQSIPRFTGLSNQVNKIQNPVARTIASLPTAFAEGIVNAPGDILAGSAGINQQFNNLLYKQPVSLSKTLASGGRFGEGILNAATAGIGSSAAKTIGKQTLGTVLKEGVKQGAKYGGIYGGLSGLQDTSGGLPGQIKSAGVGAVTGAGMGALVGPLVGATVYGLGKGAEAITAKRLAKEADLNALLDNMPNLLKEKKFNNAAQSYYRKYNEPVYKLKSPLTPREIEIISSVRDGGLNSQQKVNDLITIFRNKVERGNKDYRLPPEFIAKELLMHADQSTMKPGFVRIGKESPKLSVEPVGGEVKPKEKLSPKGTKQITEPMPTDLQGGQQPIVEPQIQSVGKIKLAKSPINQSTSTNILPRGLSTSVQEAPNVIKGVKGKVTGTYQVKPNTKLMGEAKALLESGASIDFKNTKDLDQKVAATIKQAVALQKTNPQAAANLFNNLSEHATELGRGVQAFSLLQKMSPEAIALSAAGKIKKYNTTATRKIPELTGEQTKMIADQVAKIDSLTGREKNIAINELSDLVNSFIPSSLADKAITVWKAGLLTSLRTHERNLVGNSIMGGSEVAKDVIASPVDWLLSQKTGKRTLTFSANPGEGWEKGMQSAKDIFQKGYDPEEAISKYEVNKITWGNNPIEQGLKKYTDFVFRTLGGEDKPFWQSSYARSLYDQAGAEAINAGKQGNRAFIEKLVNNPTEQMLVNATKDANYATFHDTSKLSSLANQFKRWAGEKWYTKIPAEVFAPFTGVPSSIVGKTIAYSPIGLVKGIITSGRVLAGQVPELQRQAAQEIGRGVMGTGLFGLGSYLMSKGLMTGQPKDATEARQWQLENKPSNSVLVNGKWRSINSIGPQNLVVLAGAKYQEEMKKPEGSLGAYAGGLAKDQLSQTFLSGVQQPLNAITDPARYGASYVGNQSASIIPNIIKDTSKALDTKARETSTISDYMKSGIPGLRNTLIEKRDVLGNVIPQEPTGINAFIDLFNSKTPVHNPVVDELSRLNSVGSNATPGKMTKNQTIGGVKMDLTPEQLNVLESSVGSQAMIQLQSLVSSPGYKSLPDEEKAKAIDSLMSKVRKQVKATTDVNKKTSGIVSAKTTTPSIKVKSEYMIINPETGSVKTVDLSSPVLPPELTGDSIIDKQLKSDYKSALTSRKKDIIALYKDGQIDLDTAKKLVAEIQGTYNGVSGSSKKITAKSPTLKKISLPKVSLPAVKIAKAPKLSTYKPKKISVKSPSVAKISAPKIGGVKITSGRSGGRLIAKR